MRLRPYQERMVDMIRRKWIAGERRVLGTLPTGGGKTEVAISIVQAEATPSNRALIVVGLKTLAVQWTDRLRRHGLHHIGLLQGANTCGTSAPILVAMAQTIRSRGVPEGVGLVVVDESHVWHTSHDTVLDAIGDAKVVGLTATPLRAGLGERFDAVVVGATIRELIADGFLVAPRYFAPRYQAIEDALDAVSIRAGDFAADELSTAMRGKTIMADCVSTWLRLGENRQTIAFCVDKQHARDLAAEFVGAGVTAEVVVDDTEDLDRARIFESFDRLETRVLCSVNVLSIGFDSPFASCAILARPTTSLSMHIQQGGRVLRPATGKKDCIVLDHAGNTLRHGLLEDFVPPADLSMVDKTPDRKKRKELSDAWICKHCEAVNANADDICGECGEPRRRYTTVVVVAGELVAVQHDAGDTLPGPTPQHIEQRYRMLIWFAQSKNMRNPQGWAYYAVQRMFSIPQHRAKDVISWSWRHLEPIPPDAACARWVSADYRQQKAIGNWRAKKEAANA